MRAPTGIMGVVVAGISSSEAFLAPQRLANVVGKTVTLQEQRSCVSNYNARGNRAMRTAPRMVASAAKTDAVAAVPHGGTLVDLNLKTDAEKKVC